MVTTALTALLLLAGPVANPEGEAAHAMDVREALAGEGFPWYDAPQDAARPIWPAAEEAARSSESIEADLQAGRSTVFALMTLGLVGLLAILAWSLWKTGTMPRAPAAPTSKVGRSVHRSGFSLPDELAVDLDDPWSAALRLRESGDLSGAILALFVHLLNALDRHGLCRPNAGQTARQLVRSVSDGKVRRRVEPTLRLFEASYYGHRTPTAEAFEAAWSDALALRELWESEVTA